MDNNTLLVDQMKCLTRPGVKNSLIDEKLGIIRTVFELPIKPGEPEIFNFSARMAATDRYFPVRCYDNNGGSGLTRREGRNAAIGEAVERYCCSVFDAGDFLLGSYHELSRQYNVLHPTALGLFHPNQYAKINYGRFTVHTKVAWVWGYSLVTKEPILVPACLVYIPYIPFYLEEGEEVIGPAISTGLACADFYDEALLKGIYEVVERDAFMIMWLNRLSFPSIDIRSSSWIEAIFKAKLKRNGLDYTLVNMTTDITIPSIFCLLIDSRTDPPMISTGGSANLDPEKAARKALLEAVQTREWAKFLGREDKTFTFKEDFSDIKTFEDHVALYAYGNMLHAASFLQESESVISFGEIVDRSSDDIRCDLAACVEIIAEMEMDVIAMDLTPLDIKESGFVVTRVIIPGCQQLSADYEHRFLGSKRLYEVPRVLGFARGKVEDMNPHPHPYP